MGKRKDKRKAKPSSSGEDSILEARDDKHSEKKAKKDNMAGSQAEPTMADLMSRMNAIETTLRKDFQTLFDTLKQRNDYLESQIFDLKNDRDALREDNKAIIKENKELREVMQNQGNAIRELEQYGRRDNIKVYNLVEKRHGNRGEKAVETVQAVIDMVDKDLGYKLLPSDISTAHRLGEKKPGKERSVIVRFVSRTVRNEVCSRRRALKGKPVVIADDLSPFYQGLFFGLRDLVGKKNTWTAGNQLFVQTTDGVKKVTAANYDSIVAHVTAHPLPETTSASDTGARPNLSGTARATGGAGNMDVATPLVIANDSTPLGVETPRSGSPRGRGRGNRGDLRGYGRGSPT